jgi:hypothetical protein
MPTALDSGLVFSQRSESEVPDAELIDHQEHQAPRGPLVQRLAVELLLIGRDERDNPASMIDRPPAIAAPRVDRCPDGILQRAGLERGINASQGDGAGEIRGEETTHSRRLHHDRHLNARCAAGIEVRMEACIMV